MSSFSLTRLLQMASQAFPIGGYSHSQGLEAAIECGLVAGEAAVGQWIGDVLAFSLGPYELACLRDMSVAWQRDDIAALIRSNEEFLATRESAELRSASVQMGFSMRALLQVLPALPAPLLDTLGAMAEPSLPIGHGLVRSRGGFGDGVRMELGREPSAGRHEERAHRSIRGSANFVQYRPANRGMGAER
jgi:urease accessory protein